METSFKRFQMENKIESVSADQLYIHDNANQQTILASKPWLQDPLYFKNVKISAIALIKMNIHARSGGDIEIMGMLQGRIVGDTIIIVLIQFKSDGCICFASRRN
jgi:COP9 signalosome complex subunit 5